jgi:hypothetical protein
MCRSAGLLLAVAAGQMLLAATETPAPQIRSTVLRVTRSPMALRASGAKYAGVSHDSVETNELESRLKQARDDPDWIEARSTDRIFFDADLTHSTEGLGMYRNGAKEWTSYPMSKLAIAAGWYVPPAGDQYFPDFIRGVAVAGGRVWMGSGGIGIAAMDLRDRTWSRYDVKAGVLPGIHTEVFYGDDEYLFAMSGGPTGGWEEHLPGVREADLGPALEAYSVRRDRWLRVTGVPREDVIQFGWTSSGRVSIGCDTRRFAEGAILWLELCTWPRHVEAAPARGGYLLWTEFPEPGAPLRYVIRKDLLETAFGGAGR